MEDLGSLGYLSGVWWQNHWPSLMAYHIIICHHSWRCFSAKFSLQNTFRSQKERGTWDFKHVSDSLCLYAKCKDCRFFKSKWADQVLRNENPQTVCLPNVHFSSSTFRCWNRSKRHTVLHVLDIRCILSQPWSRWSNSTPLRGLNISQSHSQIREASKRELARSLENAGFV